MSRTTLLAALLAVLTTAPLAAQRPDSVPVMEYRDLDGPRLGFLYVTGPKAEARLTENNLQPFMSVIGWHFEQGSRPRSGGPQLVIEEVLVVAGLDQGKAIPSGSLLFGIRTEGGLEFGMGPNISPVGAALAIGIGRSLRYGDVTIPLNLAMVVSQGAVRTSFLIGYAIRRH
jgi:hypothetical protein